VVGGQRGLIQMSEGPPGEANLEMRQVPRYLNEAFDTCDITVICRAIGDVTRLYNIADLARKAGLERPSLYRAFSGDGLPNFSTVLAVLEAMNLQMKVIRRKTSRRGRAGSAKSLRQA
jgi:probable addiction module antidote protein